MTESEDSMTSQESPGSVLATAMSVEELKQTWNQLNEELVALMDRLAPPAPAPVFVQLRNARDQPIAIDRTKVLSVEGLGSVAGAGPDAAEYCNIYLAMLDQPLVVKGTEEEVVAAVEGGSNYDPRTGLHGVLTQELDRLAAAREIANRQANDPRLWFADPTAEEAYLQAALRELTEAIEGKSGEDYAREVLAGERER